MKTRLSIPLPHILLLGLAGMLLVILLISAVAASQAEQKSPLAQPDALPETIELETMETTEPEAAVEPETAETRDSETAELGAAEIGSIARHESYVQGTDGFFLPEQSCTRAEFAQILCNLGLEVPGDATFTDVPAASWFAPAVERISGLIKGYDDNTFRPSREITLAEVTTILCRGMGVDLVATEGPWYAPYWSTAEGLGWLDGVDGTQPGTPAVRWMVVSVCNRAMGRIPDKAAIDGLEGMIFVDVAPGCAGYYDILEAAVAHGADWNADSLSLQRVTPGVHRAGNRVCFVQPDGEICNIPGILNLNDESYLVGEDGYIVADGALHMVDGTPVFCQTDGTLLKNGAWHDFRFDIDGRYTSGDADVDAYVETILAEITTEDMTGLEKLQACYNYVRGYSYLGRNAVISDKVMPWDKAVSYANKIYATGKGDCYNFAAAFYFLAKRLGYDATAIVGQCAYRWGTVAHGWVEITIDGTLYLFDPQIENYNMRCGIDNLSHSAFQVTYETAPGVYIKN